MQVNMERLRKNLLQVGGIAKTEGKGYTRTAFTPGERMALEWLKDKLNRLPVSVSQDRIGNVFGRFGAAGLPAIAMGSHLDTVPEGGLYDGALGVVAALECLQTLIESDYSSNDAVELICFVGEEANPLGGTFGSRVAAGLLSYSVDLETRMKTCGFTWQDVGSSKIDSQHYRAFLELHIEQGGLLEANGKTIGIVTSIAGILRLSVHVAGKANHAGTTPMHLRNDALVQASALVQEVNRLAAEANSEIVATVGEMKVFPNLANVVPGRVELTVEIRGSNRAEMEEMKDAIVRWIDSWLQAEVSVTVDKPPNDLSPEIGQRIERACLALHVPYQWMYSGANHDASSMTWITEVGMIFVPSKDGVSHHPDEFTSWEDIEIGANVLLQSLIGFSGSP